MKLLFSLILSFTYLNICWARTATLITYSKHHDLAQHIRDLIVLNGHLPASLIKIKKETPPCKLKTESIIHLCVTDDRKMMSLKIDKEVVLKTFKVFNGR